METLTPPPSVASGKPVPTPDSESAPFWDCARRGVLSIQSCNDCGHLRFPATTYCPSCRSPATHWVECSGRGKVFSWIVVHHPVPAGAYKDDVPYIVAIVMLDEGPRIVSNVVGCPPAEVHADMPVQVEFTERDGIVLPVFRRAA